MGLFSNSIAEINIDFYGQRKKHKAMSNVQVYCQVSIIPHNTDPKYLANLYSKAFIKYSEITNMSAERELFWTYVNESYKNIAIYPSSIFYIWPSFIDVAPLMGVGGGKAVTIKVSLMDNNKMKYKLTENAVSVYYNTIAPVALMQHILNILAPDQFLVFYEIFRQNMNEEIRTSKRPAMLSFNLEPLNALGRKQPAKTERVSSRFCGNCGNKIDTSSGETPKFCGGCGSPVTYSHHL